LDRPAQASRKTAKGAGRSGAISSSGELLALLEMSGNVDPRPVASRAGRGGLSKLRVELCHHEGSQPAEHFQSATVCDSISKRRARLADSRSGPSDWLEQLPATQVRAFQVALTGLHKLSGVDLHGDQLDALLNPYVAAYEMIDRVCRSAGRAAAGRSRV